MCIKLNTYKEVMKIGRTIEKDSCEREEDKGHSGQGQGKGG